MYRQTDRQTDAERVREEYGREGVGSGGRELCGREGREVLEGGREGGGGFLGGKVTMWGIQLYQ